MTDMKITGAGGTEGFSPLKPAGREQSSVFESIMQEAMGTLSEVQQNADKAVKELASGGDVTQAVLSMEKAELNFQLMIEVRNKLLSAYEEIIKMGV
ncbi:MAG: flagellar hook-basal body complex protein FliE [Nitrospirota bacterium]